MGPLAKSAAPVIRNKIDEPGVSFVPSNVNLRQAAVNASPGLILRPLQKREKDSRNSPKRAK